MNKEVYYDPKKMEYIKSITEEMDIEQNPITAEIYNTRAGKVVDTIKDMNEVNKSILELTHEQNERIKNKLDLIVKNNQELIAKVSNLEKQNKILERALELCLFEDAPDYDTESRCYWVEDMKQNYIDEAKNGI